MKIENTQKSFDELLSLIQKARQSAYRQINQTLINLYLSVGEYISHKTDKDNWGRGIVEELAKYIKEKDPSIGGFTARNIWRMKKIYETYSNNPKLTPLVSQVSWTNNLIILSGDKNEE